MKKSFFLFNFIFLLIVVFVGAHSNVLYDVSIDFDPELKENIVETAKFYLGIDEEPVRFDFDKELIVVKFDRSLEYSVTINPTDYSVSGFRDDSLVSMEEVVLDQIARKNIAEELFNTVPENYKSELLYGEEKKLYIGTYLHTWYRYIDNVLVADDNFQVEVDGATGDVVAWRLSVFFYPTSQIKTIPAIDHQVAQHIALLELDAESLEFDPVLVIHKDGPVWITKVKQLYPIFAAIDALNGKLLYIGAPRGEIPEGYDYGREVEVVESDIVMQIYNS